MLCRIFGNLKATEGENSQVVISSRASHPRRPKPEVWWWQYSSERLGGISQDRPHLRLNHEFGRLEAWLV